MRHGQAGAIHLGTQEQSQGLVTTTEREGSRPGGQRLGCSRREAAGEHQGRAEGWQGTPGTPGTQQIPGSHPQTPPVSPHGLTGGPAMGTQGREDRQGEKEASGSASLKERKGTGVLLKEAEAHLQRKHKPELGSSHSDTGGQHPGPRIQKGAPRNAVSDPSNAHYLFSSCEMPPLGETGRGPGMSLRSS